MQEEESSSPESLVDFGRPGTLQAAAPVDAARSCVVQRNVSRDKSGVYRMKRRCLLSRLTELRDCRGRKSKWVAATVANLAERGQPAFARGFEHKRSQKRSGL
ncbi:hypothetical protein TGVEG_320465 [Toxoplasma gondii VEG]|uniref:Uncharacterized protein n=1 Tax=Toxoplasma gondii (strain ATCC 50861 / VEG) TaxID=432359 RepID=V4Z7A6_TOXGV|nr:hypothetical protein TGVEG_320465 [Toxoplasma gondii VEG]